MKANWNNKAVLEMVKRNAESVLENVGEMLSDDIKKSMKPGHYRLYYSRNPKKMFHWSSAPGDPPAPDTERLKDSITWACSSGNFSMVGPAAEMNDGVSVPAAKANETRTIIGTKVPYASYLEFGTSKIEPRPFLRTALEKNRRKIWEIIQLKMKIK